MSTCRKLRVTSRLPSSRPDDVTTPSFWSLSELLHIVFTHKLNLWYVTALFAVMNLSLFTLVCLKLQGSEPLCRHTPAISSQCKRQGIIVYSSRSLWLSHPNSASIRQVLVEPESSAYPPQSCPFGGCVHVPGQGYWERRRLTLPLIEIPWCFIVPVLQFIFWYL